MSFPRDGGSIHDHAAKFRRAREADRLGELLAVSGFELGHYTIERESTGAQQHQQVEQQVGRFLDQLLIGFVDAGQRRSEERVVRGS